MTSPNLNVNGTLGDISFASVESSSPAPQVMYYYVVSPYDESGYESQTSQQNITASSVDVTTSPLTSRPIVVTASPLTSSPIVNAQSNVAACAAAPGESRTVASTLVFFDLETTGLPRFNGLLNTQITEISFIAVARIEFERSESHDLKDVRVINKMSLCVKPRCSVDYKAGQITGLTDAKLLLQHSFDESTAQMLNNFIMHLPQPVCLLAHNGIDFDFPLLKAELRRVGYSLPSNVLVADTLIAVRTFDIFNMSANGTGRNPKQPRNYKPNSLENLFKHFFKKKPINKHSSEGDCQALMMVSHKLKEKILPWIDENQCLFNTIAPMW